MSMVDTFHILKLMLYLYTCSHLSGHTYTCGACEPSCGYAFLVFCCDILLQICQQFQHAFPPSLHTYSYTHTHTHYSHTYVLTQTTHTHIHTHTYTHKDTHISLTRTHNTFTHSHVHTMHTHTYTHACHTPQTHTCAHTHTHVHSHTHSYTHIASTPQTRYITSDSVSNNETVLVFQLVSKLAGQSINYV